MKATKKLIGASCALVAALAVSVGSTFAWFSSNQSVKLDDISATVTTGSSSLEVREVNSTGAVVDGSEWGYSLAISTEKTLKGIKLDAVTSGAEGNTGTDNGVSLKKRDRTTDAGATSYVQFYLQFRVNKSDAVATAPKIKLGSGTIDCTPNVDAENSALGWTTATYGDINITAGNAIDANAKWAMRGAFIPATKSTNLTLGTSAGVWAPNEAEHNGSYTTENTQNLAKDYEQNVVKPTPGDLDTAYADVTKDTNYKAYTGGEIVTLVDGSDDLEGYYTGYMCVRLWIEGTDSDCLNNIFNDTVKISLAFTLA